MWESVLFFVGLMLGAMLRDVFSGNGMSVVFYDTNAIKGTDLPNNKGTRYVPVDVQAGKSVGEYIADITV